MGFLKPESDPVLLSSDSRDPIWDAVREEAKLEAEKEPILSSFLYASILSHDCLEQALAFVLANRLQNPTLLATQLLDIISNVIMKDRGLPFPAILSSSTCFVEPRTESTGLGVAKPNQQAARIGEGILLDHGMGVVVGETAVIGNRVSLMHGVTLGGAGKENGDRHPKLGDGALIGACVTMVGNIKICEGAMVAAGSLVLKDVPPHNTVAGTPAKVIGYVDEKDPSLTMNHGHMFSFQTSSYCKKRDA